MKIECLLRRKGGSIVTLGVINYHFLPEAGDPNGPHSAEVEDKAHIERLLSIKEGYAILGAATAADDVEQGDAVEIEAGEGLIFIALKNTVIPMSVFEAMGLSLQDQGLHITEAVTAADDEDDAEPPQRRSVLPDVPTDTTKPAGDAGKSQAADPYAEKSSADLAAAIKTLTGKAPNPTTGRPKLIATLEAAIKAQA